MVHPDLEKSKSAVSGTTVKLYEQIDDILDRAADFHGQLSRVYRDMTDRVEKKRVAVLLQYLGRHEKRLQHGLKTYNRQENREQGRTWLQYVPREDGLLMEDLKLSTDMTVDDLIEVIVMMANRLTSFYREIGGSVSLPPEIRDIFNQLAEQEEQEKVNMVQTAERIKKT